MYVRSVAWVLARTFPFRASITLRDCHLGIAWTEQTVRLLMLAFRMSMSLVPVVSCWISSLDFVRLLARSCVFHRGDLRPQFAALSQTCWIFQPADLDRQKRVIMCAFCGGNSGPFGDCFHGPSGGQHVCLYNLAMRFECVSCLHQQACNFSCSARATAFCSAQLQRSDPRLWLHLMTDFDATLGFPAKTPNLPPK